MTEPLFPALLDPPAEDALRFGGQTVTYEQLSRAAGGVAARVGRGERIALWATPTIETCVGTVGVLVAGAVAVPINPNIGATELQHIVTDCRPVRVIAPDGADLPPALAALDRMRVELDGAAASTGPSVSSDAPAFVVYTSGTTGPPKGVVLPRRAVSSNLDALADVWEWTHDDVVVHGLPLFHVHGLILGVLGPIRLGGCVAHIGRFSPEAAAAGLAAGGTMMFGVPTMYHRLADALDGNPSLAAAIADARVLVSGSAPLAVSDHTRIENATGQRIVERYGLTETLMNCAVRYRGDRRPGYVGPPLPGIDLRLVDEGSAVLEAHDDESIGEVQVRGPNLFTEYLNRPEATAAVVQDGWFSTGDLATRADDGYIRIVGRRATDLIKTGGFKVGAGEVENALIEHDLVAEAAVIGEPDADLGERIVAFVVLRDGARCSAPELIDHVAAMLAPHKRPRAVRFVTELPRNEMGKLRKAQLKAG